MEDTKFQHIILKWWYEIRHKDSVYANAGESVFETEEEAIKDAEEFKTWVAKEDGLPVDELSIDTFMIEIWED